MQVLISIFDFNKIPRREQKHSHKPKSTVNTKSMAEY